MMDNCFLNSNFQYVFFGILLGILFCISFGNIEKISPFFIINFKNEKNNQNKYFLISFVSIVALFFILSFIFSKLFYYPIGALTRIGNLSEKDYGENKKQEDVNI